MSQRHQSPYSFGVQIARIAWAICQTTLFRFSPRPLPRWRVWLLRCFGAGVDRTARIHPAVRIQFPWNLRIAANVAVGEGAILYALGKIELGPRVTISQYAHLCAGTHDYRTREMPLVRRPITIKADAWVASGAFVGPGVTVAEGAILSAHGVAMRNLEPWKIWAGNPASVVKDRPPMDGDA